MARLRVAISGGGIASLCLAHALTSKYSHLEVKVFEGSSVYREDSAAIGLAANAQKALSLLSPTLRKAVDEAGGGTGPDQGRHIGDFSPVIPQIVVHRGAFWRKLRDLIPDDVLQMSKRLVQIDCQSDVVELSFEDDSTYEADCLIGCDGITSITRQTVLGPDHAATFTKGYGHRLVIPIEEAVSAFGKEYCDVQTQHGWIGRNALLLTDHLDSGRSMQVIVGGLSLPEPWPYPEPFKEWPIEILEKELAEWGTFGQSYLEIFKRRDKLYAAGNRIHFDTPTYYKGPICLAGDAAHTFFPTQGAGAGQAIEDALMLSTVLGACHSRDNILRAFETYDALRRPRRSSIAKSSFWAGAVLTGNAPNIGLDPERIAEVLPQWGSNIYNYDLEAAQIEALEKMGIDRV